MASPPEDDGSGAGRRRLLPLVVICLVLGLAAVVIILGRGGCGRGWARSRKKELEEKAGERAKTKPKLPFEIGQLATRPASEEPVGGWYKPAHWTETTLKAKANEFDFRGDLEFVVTDGKGQRPIPLPATRFDLTTCRGVILPKRQPREFESVLFVPPASQDARVSCRLSASKGGRRAYEGSRPLTRMPSYQYHFVVLARLPESYTYLSGLASVNLPSDTFTDQRTEPYYRLALMKAERQVALPSHGSSWTSIACILWDQADPDALDPNQRQSLLDWLHWGGQLIISGPGTVDPPPDFLLPYLPAIAAGNRELSEDDFKELNGWANQNKSVRRLAPGRPLGGIHLKKHPQARFIPGSGGLLVERRVGRGRVVVSAFRLSGPTLTSWQGLDEMFNAFLLRRPARKFGETQYGFIEGIGQLAEEADATLRVEWADGRDRLDAARISNLRYFTRDTGVKMFPQKGPGGFVSGYGADVRAGGIDTGEEPEPGPGVAAWNDFNPVADAAREALVDAARIKIPDHSFVVWIVAGYLVVLVPANWLVFRMLGRVEWAWAAAPAIAIVCTVVVVRAAQLDIGFARSRTEIAVVEVQAGYPRAHVTRYTVLYTSLTTHYDFHFEDPGAVVQPFPEVASPEQFRMRDRRGLFYRRGQGASLLGYHVSSNTTGMVHGEQTVDLGGALSLAETSGGRLQVVNQTELTLYNAGVIRRDERGNLQVCWIGTLQKGKPTPLTFSRLSPGLSGARLWEERRSGSKLAGTGLDDGELSLRRLVELAQDLDTLRPGEVRLVAGLEDPETGFEEPVAGLVIEQEASQSEYAALVVAHLRYGPGEDPKPDVNTRYKPEQTRRGDPGMDLQNSPFGTGPIPIPLGR